MRVLVVSANQERSPDPVAPLGACYVATAVAAAGHDTELLDLCFSDDVEAEVRDAVAAHRPDVIGLAMRNGDNCPAPASRTSPSTSSEKHRSSSSVSWPAAA